MARVSVLIICTLALLAYTASCSIVEHTFKVGNLSVSPLCKKRVVVAVNDRFPGPTIRVREGDTLIVHVINDSPYNITIHWHGVFQRGTPWYDGPSYVTQCPIKPGASFTYKFALVDQEGTLWWHAHVSWLRATVYGALIIRPRIGQSGYPFPKPDKEIPLMLGEWWNANVVDLEGNFIRTGSANISDAFTINGRPGDLYPCSSGTYKLNVDPGKKYLLRIINAALNNQLFFKIANHNLLVVGVDASYTNPYKTDVVVVAPGQTVDALLVANQPPASYYMAARAYISAPNTTFDSTTATGILVYKTPNTTKASPIMPSLPAFNDTPTAHKYYTDITGLVSRPKYMVPLNVDVKMFITVGLGLSPCAQCARGSGVAGSMNNESFVIPNKTSMLEAQFYGTSGIFTKDFPDRPPLVFDYTNSSLPTVPFWFPNKSTRTRSVAYNSTVEMVFQNTAIVAVENHPIHLHGFDFYVLAQGFGNFNETLDRGKFNLVNPQMRNTIAVPVGGWAVVRFVANNPGVWLLHCHLDVHLPTGLATAFVVENGPTPSSKLPPPPADLPKC
ncbi:hypothetical protein AMTRI_Chr08g202660 [Amborella trichopoda]|uniref:Laccase n=1 Tax=Amborella trichopoda TaxID=13333 RepID=W1PQW4_AMBTC|nr:laccase-7 [Amborella trichopoda]ERN09615.1 hypothetical protein AMTR_s00029p00185120 [Amborella trichopoda]|eukprot:XP_006848034.1 laccase-7 [Amborella trichopoda]